MVIQGVGGYLVGDCVQLTGLWVVIVTGCTMQSGERKSSLCYGSKMRDEWNFDKKG